MLAVIAAIFATSSFWMVSSGGLRILPHAMQKLSLNFGVGVHRGQFSVGLVNIWVLNIFSEVASSSSVPRNMSTQPPRRWNAWRARASP